MKVHTSNTIQRLVLVGLSFCILCSLALYGVGVSAGAPQPPLDSATRLPAKQPPAFKAGQILVAFKPGAALNERQTILETRSLRVLKQIEALGVSVLAVPAGRERSMVDELGRLPAVRYAELNYLMQASGTPNDPSFGQQWNMNAINGPAAWDVSTGSISTTIAILDTGIDLTHPDLQDKIVAGYDFVNNDATAQDDEGHGTHCAGIAAASSNNGVGVAGVNWQARLMPVKVLDNEGSGTYADVAEGLHWAADHGATVISMSFGGSGESQTLREAVDYAYGRGALMAAAAGNEYQEGNPVTYPAALEHVIGVAATTISNWHAWYSNTGYYVDIAAPGGEAGNAVLSTLWTSSGHSYGRLAGTSMAAPHVAGLAALIKAVNPALTPAQIEWVMEYTAADLGDRGRDDVFGWGRINALAAVNAATDPQPTPTPTVSTCLIESAHPYANNYSRTWTVVNPNGAAPYTRVHFSRLEVEAGWDVVQILDSGGNLRQTISGSYPNGLWSDAVAGPVVQVVFSTDGSITQWGFCLDAVETAGASPTPTATATPTGTLPPTPTASPTVTPSPTPLTCLLESPHPYADSLDVSWTITNTDTTAAYSRIHFARLETETGFDYVSLRTPDGIELARYSGWYPDGVWSPVFRGRTLEIRLHTDSSVVAWGFCVDSIVTAPEPAWRPQAALPDPRSRLAVVSVGSKLYALGGETAWTRAGKKPTRSLRDTAEPDNLADEGVGTRDIAGLVDEYDPTTDAWTRRADKPLAVSNISAAVINGRIYVAGGYTAADAATTALEIYDPATNSWSQGAPLPAGRFAHASAALDGKLYVLGGNDGVYGLRTCYRFDPATNQWSQIADMNVERTFAGAAAVNGKIYVVGGLDAISWDLASVEAYDPATNRWDYVASLRFPRGGPGVASAGGKVYVVGGGWTSYMNANEVYDPATGEWSTFDPMTVGRRTLGLAAANGRLYAVGGYNGNYSGAHESHAVAHAEPSAVLNPTSLTYRLEQGQSAEAVITLSNVGWADLTFFVSDELLRAQQDAPWLSEAPTAGVVEPGDSQAISVTVATAGLTPGEYLAQLVVLSNDPARSRLTAPITLTVDARNPVTLSFNPQHSDVALNSAFRVDVMLATEAQPVDSVDAYITFDPRILQVVDAYGNPTNQITAGTDLPLVLQNTANNATGRIAFGAGRRLGDRPPAGTFRLATIRFRAVSQTVAVGGMPLLFDAASQVYYGGESILGRAENGSVIVQAPWFIGRAALQGRGRAPSTRWAGYPVTVTLLDQAGAPVRAFETTLDENGRFTILTPPSGTFGVTIKGSHTLSNARQNVTLPSPAVVDLGTLREGDVNNDDRVAGGDFSLLVTAYNTRPGDERWDARADLDGDERVAVADFSLLASNYGQRGPLALTGAPAAPTSAARAGSGSMELWIEPARRLVDPSDTFVVTMILNAGEGQMDAIGTTIAFDPTILQVVDAAGNPVDQIIPGAALPTVILNQVDNAAGRIAYDAGVALGSAPKSGRIVVATVRFKALQHTSSGLGGTPIDFLPGSDAYLAGEPQLSQRTGAAVIVAVKVARANLPQVMD